MSKARGPAGPVLLGFNVLLAVFFGAAAFSLFSDALGPGDLIMPVLLLDLALIILGSVGVHLLRHRFPRGLRRPQAVTLDGEPAIFLPDWPTGARSLVLFASLTCVPVVLVALALLQSSLWLLGLPVLFAAGYLLVFVVLALMGRWRAGGLWLTPTRVVHHRSGTRSVIAWEELRGVEATADSLLLIVDGRVSRFSRHTMPPLMREPLADGSQLTVWALTLGIPLAGLTFLVDRFRTKPETRTEIGDGRALAAFNAASYAEALTTRS